MDKLIVVFAIFILSACETDFDPPPLTSNENPNSQELSQFFSRFENEAANRGLLIDLESLDIQAEIAPIDEQHVAGTCHYSTQQGRHITIDDEFWNHAGFTTKEMVVFHELAHCVLFQGHREQTDENGNCLSIMQSGTQGCTLLYNQQNRDYYLDELFFFEN